MEPVFLDIDLVLRIHGEQIKYFGGSDGLRDLGLLQSAIAQPQSGFAGQFAHKDIFEMAAAYLFHIASNHPFIDGNKRAGYDCAITFLAVNDIEINAPADDIYDMVISVTKGELEKPEIANFFRNHAVIIKKAQKEK